MVHNEAIQGEPARFTGAVTGIGSLPCLSVSEAIAAVAQYSPAVPFWPQLPRLSPREQIVAQGLGLLSEWIEPREAGYGFEVKPGRIEAVVTALQGSTGALLDSHAAGFREFEKAAAQGRFAAAVALKGQIEGPVTLGTYLYYRGQPFLRDASLFAALAHHVDQCVIWQVDVLKRSGLPVLLFLDEPALGLERDLPADRLGALTAIFERIRASGAFGGLHCCAAQAFDRMFAVNPDVLSFDAHSCLQEFFRGTRAVDFVERGGWIAYGLIPAAADWDGLEASSIFGAWLSAATATGEPRALAQRAMATAACGLGLLDSDCVPRSFQLARETGVLLRRFASQDRDTVQLNGTDVSSGSGGESSAFSVDARN